MLGSLRLTANMFSKMSVVPDLVILNACHLGRVERCDRRWPGPTGRRPASAGRLLRLGVRAVVVAGWAVDDGAAEAVRRPARTRGSLAGDDFGAAVTGARQAGVVERRRAR